MINRAYYATSLTNGATYGFLNMLLRAIQDTRSTHVAIAFDVRAKTFRHKLFEGYKAHRKGMPDDLAAQFADLKTVLATMKIAMLECEGYEADDVIGTIAKKTAEAGQCSTAILSADRDCLQLVGPCVELHLTKTGVTNIDIWTTDRIRREYGFAPSALIDLKALMGDKSDNIPGAAGVGEKTALTLIREYGSIEELYKTTENPKLLDQKDMVLLSKTLAAIDCNVPVEYAPETYRFTLPMSKDVFSAFRTRNFHSLCNRKNLWSVAGHCEERVVGKQPTSDEATPRQNSLTPKPTQLSFLDTPAQPATQAPQIDADLDHILVKMHNNGAKIDLVTLQQLSDKYVADINAISVRIFTLAGEKFNINSPQQLGGILYKKFGIETTQKTKTGLSTNEAVLHKIEKMHPIVPEILRYRKVYKLYSTYVQGIKNLVDTDGFVHSTFQSNTITGRLSSIEPNLQNIPRREQNASDSGGEIRSLFISRFLDGKILTADYSQIELRILAHLSGDPTMQNAFKNGRDIHEETATALGVDRRTAKAVNFGITYGQTAFGLAETLGCSVGDASRFIGDYFARFERVKTFLDECRDFAISHGYIETMFGRRRYLPELASKNQHMVGFATRAAMNMPMQGAAADIIKRAMLAIDEKMTAANLKSVMFTQIHDELVFDCPADEAETMSTLVKDCMEAAATLDVPLVATITVKETL